MALRINTTLLLLSLLLLSSGIVEGLGESTNRIYSLHKDGVPVNSRKLLVFHEVLDYDYAGSNPKHDPRKGKPVGGGNGRNP
ncbi:hypothetical protein F0562_026751 [Nyssa sinensis]|uniref:Dirigent protein n=1 Tax=Nyssa sinensis TaxID=561372 RepID=A0A5J5BBJ6_9ASTE|nr:hypothetical protein F0562_026751 [Nyssa sinensis]